MFGMSIVHQCHEISAAFIAEEEAEDIAVIASLFHEPKGDLLRHGQEAIS